jgi:hypothetical protein
MEASQAGVVVWVGNTHTNRRSPDESVQDQGGGTVERRSVGSQGQSPRANRRKRTHDLQALGRRRASRGRLLLLLLQQGEIKVWLAPKALKRAKKRLGHLTSRR